MLRDRWGRPVNNLRISVTPECNFRCFFCHREGYSPTDRMMMADEIGRIVSILVKHDVKTVKITGGEPLLRDDIVEIVRAIKEAGAEEISMVTNGYLLSELAQDLKEAGLDRVNISIHSLDRNVYELITGVDALDRGLEAVKSAKEAGLEPVKVDMVVLRGLNSDNLWESIEFFSNMGVQLQLIELLYTDSKLFTKYYYPLTELERELEKRSIRVEVRDMHGRKRYHLPNGGTVELVRNVDNPNFCMRCTRIRITHDGYFKTCLLRKDDKIDFLTAMRSGASDEELEEIFKKAVMLREPFYKPAEEVINVRP